MVTWHSRGAIRHLFYRHVTRSRTRCSNAFLTVASKCTYVSSRRAIALGSLFHRLRYATTITPRGRKNRWRNNTSAVCDRGKSKRLFTNSCVYNCNYTDEKSWHVSRYLQLIARVALNRSGIIKRKRL